MRRFRAILHKEIRENLRDRRALAMALLFPIIGPLILVVLVSTVARTTRGEVDAPVRIAVAGRANAPNLVAFLESLDCPGTLEEIGDQKAEGIEPPKG